MKKVFKPGAKAGLLIFCAILIFSLAGPQLMAMDKQVADNPLYYPGMRKVAATLQLMTGPF